MGDFDISTGGELLHKANPDHRTIDKVEGVSVGDVVIGPDHRTIGDDGVTIGAIINSKDFGWSFYPKVDLAPVRRAFTTFTRIYSGTLPGYHGCDTAYHDAQHSLDCTLAMARLLDGHERTARKNRLGPRRARIGVICALFHDVGYIRRLDEHQFRNGAELTLCHVTRSGEFLSHPIRVLFFL